jgi:hypothetical protein
MDIMAIEYIYFLLKILSFNKNNTVINNAKYADLDREIKVK